MLYFIGIITHQLVSESIHSKYSYLYKYCKSPAVCTSLLIKHKFEMKSLIRASD